MLAPKLLGERSIHSTLNFHHASRLLFCRPTVRLTVAPNELSPQNLLEIIFGYYGIINKSPTLTLVQLSNRRTHFKSFTIHPSNASHIQAQLSNGKTFELLAKPFSGGRGKWAHEGYKLILFYPWVESLLHGDRSRSAITWSNHVQVQRHKVFKAGIISFKHH